MKIQSQIGGVSKWNEKRNEDRSDTMWNDSRNLKNLNFWQNINYYISSCRI